MGRLVLKRSGPQGQIWYRGQVWSFGCKKMFQKHTGTEKNHLNIHFSLKFTSAIWSDPDAICSDFMRSVNPILHRYISASFSNISFLSPHVCDLYLPENTTYLHQWYFGTSNLPVPPEHLAWSCEKEFKLWSVVSDRLFSLRWPRKVTARRQNSTRCESLL